MGARRALQDRVALIGFDDFPVADLPAPGISVVSQDAGRVGRTAARPRLGQDDLAAGAGAVRRARVGEISPGQWPSWKLRSGSIVATSICAFCSRPE